MTAVRCARSHGRFWKYASILVESDLCISLVREPLNLGETLRRRGYLSACMICMVLR